MLWSVTAAVIFIWGEAIDQWVWGMEVLQWGQEGPKVPQMLKHLIKNVKISHNSPDS